MPLMINKWKTLSTAIDVPCLITIGTVMNHCHQCPHDSTRIGVLVNVSTVNHPLCPLRHQRSGFHQHNFEIFFPAPADKNGNAGSFDNTVKLRRV
jgi:hypothetical protein